MSIEKGDNFLPADQKGYERKRYQELKSQIDELENEKVASGTSDARILEIHDVLKKLYHELHLVQPLPGEEER